MANEETLGVKTLLGDPKKAIIKLSVPMIFAMLIQTLYNVIDAVWVAGLGSNALAAVGFTFPFYILAMGLANGVGIGGSSAISRRIGAKDKPGADNIAIHSIILIIIVTIAYTVPLFLLARPLFELMGAGKTIELTLAYSQVIFIGSFFLFFSNIANAILRGEGDAKRAMYAMALGGILNIILDPIFIYTLDMGIAGAAWATILSLAISSLILCYWLLFKKNTYVDFQFKYFQFNKDILKEIFSVGLPAAVQQMSMSLSMILLNLLIVSVSNTDGVAVYTTGWRIVMIAVLPLIGIATAIVSVSGAAYGEKAYDKVNISHLYAVKIGLIIEMILGILTFIFAPQIVAIFTQSEGTIHIADDLVLFTRIMVLFYPGASLGMLSASLLQGIKHGFIALISTILRALIFTTLFAYLFALVIGMDLVGVWWGIIIANLSGGIISFLWARNIIKQLLRKQTLDTNYKNSIGD
jgi:putative MATE family efflux protein